MGRRQSTASRDAAGVHHVASRLSHKGFRVTVVPSAGGAAEVLALHEEDWDAVEEHLLAGRSSQTGWIIREELEEAYGENFVEALDEEAARLLGEENSTLRSIADWRFPAEGLADAQALLSVLFRRHMQQRDQREEEYRRQKKDRSG